MDVIACRIENHVSFTTMNAENTDQLGAGLVYEDTVPMRWKEVGKEIQPSQLIRINESNEEILRFISVLDEYRSESSNETHGSSLGDMTRIEYKMNLILDLVSQILVHHVDMPHTVPIRMNATGILWKCEAPLNPGQYVLLDIYFYQKYPRPIVLPGKIQSVEKAGDGYNTWVSFEDINDTVRRWLDKLIFRQHRRGVAHARRSTYDKEQNENRRTNPDSFNQEN